MAYDDQREIFNSTGPSFLTEIDWNNSHHRRSIAASLVQGVYTLERDRQQNRQGPQALAPPWWLFFNFHLIQVLVDPKDTSCFGAVYESAKSPSLDPTLRAPHYVVALRGSTNKPGNRERDFKLNLQLLINNLEKSSRFQIASQSVIQLVQTVGPGNVWLAGHSLGSSIALLLGKQMVRSGIHLETYLFNPPFGSPHIERIKNDKVKLGLRFANSVITAGLAAAVQRDKGRAVDPFAVLAGWVPYLFINPSDPICSEYVGYFKHREDMEAIGAGKIGRLATKHSIGSIFSMGKKECEAVHLIPSAYLSINGSRSQSFKEAHGIHQWWRPDLHFIYKYYQYKQ